MLNYLENPASLKNLPLLEGFPKSWKVLETGRGGSYLDEPSSTSVIDTTHATLVKAVCIYDGYSHARK